MIRLATAAWGLLAMILRGLAPCPRFPSMLWALVFMSLGPSSALIPVATCSLKSVFKMLC